MGRDCFFVVGDVEHITKSYGPTMCSRYLATSNRVVQDETNRSHLRRPEQGTHEGPHWRCTSKLSVPNRNRRTCPLRALVS